MLGWASPPLHEWCASAWEACCLLPDLGYPDYGRMGRGGQEERQRQGGKGKGRTFEQQRSHYDDCTGPRPAGARPRGGPTGQGKGFQATPQDAAPTYGQGPSYTHHRGMGVSGMRSLQLDDQALLPPETKIKGRRGDQARRAQAPGASCLYCPVILMHATLTGVERGAGPPGGSCLPSTRVEIILS